MGFLAGQGFATRARLHLCRCGAASQESRGQSKPLCPVPEHQPTRQCINAGLRGLGQMLPNVRWMIFSPFNPLAVGCDRKTQSGYTLLRTRCSIPVTQKELGDVSRLGGAHLTDVNTCRRPVPTLEDAPQRPVTESNSRYQSFRVKNRVLAVGALVVQRLISAHVASQANSCIAVITTTPSKNGRYVFRRLQPGMRLGAPSRQRYETRPSSSKS